MTVPLSSNPADIRDNVERFLKAVSKSTDLQSHLSYFRGWYAFRRSDGTWALGPSKFIGYDGMTAPIYLAAAQNLNGRATEAHLKRWFTPVNEGSALHDTLSAELYRLLGRFGKAPSTAMRISVLKADAEAELNSNGATSPMIALIIAVARGMKPSEQAALKAAFSSI